MGAEDVRAANDSAPIDTDAGLTVKNGNSSPMPVSWTGAGSCALLDTMENANDSGPSRAGGT